jgi:Flp pilus assembly CpaE family ATPase
MESVKKYLIHPLRSFAENKNRIAFRRLSKPQDSQGVRSHENYCLLQHQGGVGKTVTAVNLAYLASREGVRTLVMDLDPQGAASFYFRVKPKIKGG